MTLDFRAREAVPEDLAAVRELMIRVIEQDYGYNYVDAWHDDVDNLQSFYLDHPRQSLWIAEDNATGDILGTAAVRVFRITSPPHPAHLVARYLPSQTAELTRVFTRPDARRRGIGAALVAGLCQWIVAEGGFRVIQFHSRTAVEFWRAIGSREVLDNRNGAEGIAGGQVYFELLLAETPLARR